MFAKRTTTISGSLWSDEATVLAEEEEEAEEDEEEEEAAAAEEEADDAAAAEADALDALMLALVWTVFLMEGKRVTNGLCFWSKDEIESFLFLTSFSLTPPHSSWDLIDLTRRVIACVHGLLKTLYGKNMAPKKNQTKQCKKTQFISWLI